MLECRNNSYSKTSDEIMFFVVLHGLEIMLAKLGIRIVCKHNFGDFTITKTRQSEVDVLIGLSVSRLKA